MTRSSRSPLRLLASLGIEHPGEIDVEAIAFSCGATVVYEPLQGCAGRILGYEDRAIITVDSDCSRARQRFTAAHELGHWLRDRGSVSQFSCSQQDFVLSWGKEDPERRANRFAAELLLPEPMFRRDAKDRELVFDSVRELADVYETSLTSTAIRLVKLGSFPGMIVCNERGAGRWRWFVRGPLVPDSIWPVDRPGRESVAFELLNDVEPGGKEVVPVSAWVEGDGLDRFAVHEDTLVVGRYVLSLLWWRDESHLLSILEGD
ncbi:MAG: ImmA/IrrE family metallo-endopeptidase [Acidobacteria bacterium]|nr:ImmA/IrrE family metallo-endopeptidase [Acidobacteriota bacterium]